MTRQEQCACGNEARVPEGELKPDEWHRWPSGELLCPRCWQAALWVVTPDATSPGCQEEAT